MKYRFGRMMQMMAMQRGNKEALVNVERNRRYGFLELHRLTNRIANVLRQTLKVGKGDVFMLILENDNLSLLHFPTIFKQEGTAAMTNLRDSLDEHRWQADLIGPKVAFIETALIETHAGMLDALGCTVVAMDAPSAAQREEFPKVLSFWELVEAASEEESPVELDQQKDIVMLRFTGGTTGRGKCAMYTTDNWFACRDTAYSNLELGYSSPTARMLHVAPLSHGTQMSFYPTFFAGGTNLTINVLDVGEFHRIVEAEGVTHSFLVPTVLYRLLDLQRANPRNMNSLRTLSYGAAPISPTRLSELIEHFGQIFAQGYGSTEAIEPVSVLDKADHRNDSEQAIKRLSSAGRVSSTVEVFIVDDEGRPVATGVTGEIRIRSRGVISGYYKNPEATAAEFVDGAWCSGDMGYLDEDGYLYIVDRRKDMIISGGFNVYAIEVEAALVSHPAVLNAAVVGVPHIEWGEAVHAEVQLREGVSVTAEELIAHAKAHIGSYKAPKSVVFVQQLPLSVVGKVLRRHVREKYWKDQVRNIG